MICGGGNSPYTNIFPINGVSADGNGACNADGIQVMPGSLEGCPEPHSDLVLDDTGTRLIGKKHGRITCEGERLEHATFQVRSPTHGVTLQISRFRQFNDDGPYHLRHEGYQITHDGNQLCDLEKARGALKSLGFNEPPEHYAPHVPHGYHPGPNDDLVVAMPGPVFNVNTAEPIKHPDPANFFNLACVGDALAKASFYKLTGDARDTKAALRMITANYCGRRMTVRGMHIEWQSFPPKPLESTELEAEWDQDGKAICIGTPRLMDLRVDPGDGMLAPQELSPELQPKGCESKASPSGKCDKDCWILHLRDECDVPPRCPKHDPKHLRFKSFVDVTGHSIILHDPTRHGS
jgi:hypothetical protein